MTGKLIGHPDADCFAEATFNRSNGWISFEPAILAAMIAVQLDCMADYETLAGAFAEALTSPVPGELLTPFIQQAFGADFALMSVIDGRINLHFAGKATVGGFLVRYDVPRCR